MKLFNVIPLQSEISGILKVHHKNELRKNGIKKFSNLNVDVCHKYRSKKENKCFFFHIFQGILKNVRLRFRHKKTAPKITNYMNNSYRILGM